MSDIADQILASLSNAGWKGACLSLLPKEFKNSSTNNITLGIVDQYGLPVSTLDRTAWGISHAVCQKYCSVDDIPPVSRPTLLSWAPLTNIITKSLLRVLRILDRKLHASMASLNCTAPICRWCAMA